MLLHSGASLHGHEYSEPRPSSELQKKPIPFLRSALRTKSEPDYRHFSLPPPPSSSATPTDFSTTDGTPLPSSPNSFGTASSYSHSPRLHRRTASDVVRKKDSSVRFREPPMESDLQPGSTLASEDEDSVVGSEISDHAMAPARTRRRRRTLRTSTRFAFAHPAPAMRNKQRRLVQIRPRILLQLQQVGDKRAIPAFDVVPSSLLAGSLLIPLLSKKFPRVFGRKPELDQSDVLVVRNEDYGLGLAIDSQHKRSSAGDKLDHRDVLAVISTLPGQEDQADIVLEDGSVWAASRMVNGSYGFTRIDAEGRVTTARWVQRNPPSSPAASPAASPDVRPESPSERKWTFSMINPNTRRHPILGSLTPTSLDMYDTYNTMSSSSGRFPPMRAFDPEESSPTSPRLPTVETRTTVAVTDEEKKIMMATAIWISLRQDGWPASANPKLARTAVNCRSASMRNPERARSFSGANSLGAASPAVGPTRVTSMPPGPASQPYTEALQPRRTMSTGAAFMNNRKRMSDLSEHESVTKEARGAVDKKPHSYRFRMRELAEKLFHRKGSQSQQQSALKHELKE